MTEFDLQLRPEDVLRTEPNADADVSIAMVLQLNTPDQSKFSFELNRDLAIVAVDAVHKLGGSVTVHDVAASEEPDYDAIAAADGILVLGGGDVDATLYGHYDPVPNEYGKDRRADDREITIIQRGIREDTIMLHLCRGSQLLNVACGGSLIPDLDPFELHKGPKGGPLFLDEEVNLVPGTIVHELYGADTLVVRNGHHQAVDRVGEGLRIAASAHDGVTEATERVDNTWIIGVQWHPEEELASEADRDVLFGAFLEQVRSRKAALQGAH